MKTFILIVRWIGAFLGWCLFFFWWREAARPGWVSGTVLAYSLLAIAAVVSAAVLYSALWILHNKRLARRGKRGKVSFYKPPRFETDALGRKLTLLPPERQTYDPVIVVRSSGAHKEYVVEGQAKGAQA